MTSTNRPRWWLSVFWFLFSFSACDENVKMDQWAGGISKLRDIALSKAAPTPYSLEQHQALKEYFAQIAGVVLKIKADKDFERVFTAGLQDRDLGGICREVLISKLQWQEIVANCFRGQYFLCAEEVRAYPTLVAALRVRLTPELRARFDEADSCTRSVH